MLNINDFILEKLKISSKSIINEYNYHPKDIDELKELVKQLIDERGNKANLNDIDTSEIISMDSLFKGTNFNGDISEWDVSNVIYGAYVFLF